MTSIFKYTLPSGAEYQVDGPDNATQREADEVFYSQVAAGALVGYTAGQTLSSTETQLAKFGISRLDRGTAGVDDVSILAIIGGTGIAASIPTLNGIPLSNPITQANVITASQGLGASGIGPLSAIQVQSLLAQNAAQTNQAFFTASIEKGIGKYGFTSQQLEEAGYLKPGTTARFLNPLQVPGAPNPPNFLAVMNSPSVWTGLDAIFSLDDLLANEEAQDKIQQILMRNSYTKLTNAGVIQTTTVAGVTAGTGFVYANGKLSGVNALGLLNGTSEPQSGLAGQITTALNTSSADTTVLSPSQVLANSIAAESASSNPIQSVLSGIQQGQAYLKQAQQVVGSITQVAGKFGTTAAQLWTKGLPGLESSAGGIIKGQIAGLEKQAVGIVNNIKGQAAAVVNQGKAAIDSVGKMGKYAVDFANGKIDSLTSGVKQAAAFTDTVNRTTVDQAVKGILGNNKIPTPDFSSASALNASVGADIAFAQNALNGLNNQVGTVLAQGQAIAGQVQGSVNFAQSLFGQTKNIGTNLAGQITNRSRLG